MNEEADEHHNNALQFAARTLGIDHPIYESVKSGIRLDADIETPFCIYTS